MGSLVNDGLVQTFITEDALDSAGYVLTFGATAGKVKKCDEDDVVVGFAFTSTKDPISGTATANVPVGVIMKRSGIVVNLLLEDDNQAISYGDPLCPTSDANEKGKVDLKDGANETGTLVAYALESKNADSGGTIKALIV